MTAFLMMMAGALNAQTNFNLTKVANVPYAEGCNDIWGYVDSSGIEYALLGTRQATAIISLEDPANPVEVAYIQGSTSTWRDMKTWGHYAYVTADAGNDGLLIINLENLPNAVTWEFWKPDLTIGGNSSTLSRCHNIFIDEKGYAFLSGCNPLNNGGVIIFDVHTTPGTPVLVGQAEPVYSHDNFSRGDTLYSANLGQGAYITDVSDKENPVTLGVQETSFDFCHNVWISDDSKYMFTTDEKANAFLDAYDITDPASMIRLDKYQPIDTRQTGVIPHNTHYLKGYNVVSWYTDGVKVVDSHKPDNLVEVANFDTYVAGGNGFQGDWGAYPFLPSGLLLVSDINTCLWVFDANYVRASYLEGIVIDAITKDPIQGADVVIQNVQPNEEISGPDGRFKTGSNQEGSLTVKTNKAGYLPSIKAFSMTAGEVTDVTIELTPLSTTNVTGMVLDKQTGDPVAGAMVYYQSSVVDDINYNAVTDIDGTYAIDDIYLGDYEVIAGAWSYDYGVIEALNISGQANQVLELGRAYRDDFVFDYGWTSSGTANVGLWERGIPEGTYIGNMQVNPAGDFADDLGNTCYVTGLQAGTTIGEFDLDNGSAILESPSMDLSNYLAPAIFYNAWFVNTGGNNMPNDTLKVWLTDGNTEVLVHEYTGDIDSWRPRDSIFVMDYFADLSDIRVSFVANDEVSSGHIVEAGVDAFLVADTKTSSNEDVLADAPWKVLPNPSATDFFMVLPDNQWAGSLYQVYDDLGRLVESGVFQASKAIGGHWMPGIHLLKVTNGEMTSTLRLVKLGQ
ncbi:MAG: choice-of-anchor B family protein [Saprospiraceae bacterium]|nr:choice-of-anchor B family protein [Saprospiraceae bacterium]